MNDGGNDSLFSTIWRTTAFIDEFFDENGYVLVHCQEGISRSSSLVIGFLILHNGYDYPTAYKILYFVIYQLCLNTDHDLNYLKTNVVACTKILYE